MVEVPTIFLNSFLREIIFVFVDNQFFANVLVRFASSICLFDFVRRLSFSCSGVARLWWIGALCNIEYCVLDGWVCKDVVDLFSVIQRKSKDASLFSVVFSFCSTSLFPSVSFLHKPIKKKHSLDYFCAKFPFITSKDTIFQHLPNCWLIY